MNDLGRKSRWMVTPDRGGIPVNGRPVDPGFGEAVRFPKSVGATRLAEAG
jgi:hypothetical protein